MFDSHPHPPALHSFPTRRSSDLLAGRRAAFFADTGDGQLPGFGLVQTDATEIDAEILLEAAQHQDRKSTRLNSSHLGISYAVFCLKKKKTERVRTKQ